MGFLRRCVKIVFFLNKKATITNIVIVAFKNIFMGGTLLGRRLFCAHTTITTGRIMGLRLVFL